MALSLRYPVMALEALLRLSGNRAYRQRPDEFGAFFGPGGLPEAARRCREASGDLLAFLRAAPGSTAPSGLRVGPARRAGRGLVHVPLSFDSPCPVGDPVNDRVHARVLLPSSGTRARRAVVFHHAIRHDRWRLWQWFVAPLARHAPVAIMAGPHHFERRRPGERPGLALCNGNPWRLYEGLRQWCADQQALRIVLERSFGLEVAAVAGFSLGAFESLLAAAADCMPRVPLVSIASTCWYPWGLTRGWIGAPIVEALHGVGIDDELLFELTGALDLARHVHRLRDRPVLFIEGRWDRVDPPPSPERLREALRPVRALRLEAGHGTLLLRRRAILRETIAFLGECGAIEARPRHGPSLGVEAAS